MRVCYIKDIKRKIVIIENPYVNNYILMYQMSKIDYHMLVYLNLRSKR